VTDSSAAAQPGADVRQEYRSPRLEHYGDVVELTQDPDVEFPSQPT